MFGRWKKPLVSVLLPTHNRADVLPYAIEAVLGQTVQDIELLVVGDGCTDNTSEVVQSFRDQRIRWFDLPKAPHFGYANRNIALREARGSYIGFMAHDDLIIHDHFERCLDILEKDDSVEWVYTRPIWVTPDGTVIPVAYNLHNPDTFDLFMARQVNGIPASCVVHRRSCLEDYGYWNDALPACGDWDMWIRIIEGGGRQNFAFLSEPTCLHFRANWRTEKNAGPDELKIWRTFYDKSALVPESLQVSIPEGVPEQRVFWEHMSADQVGWARSLRKAVVQVFDLRLQSMSQEASAMPAQ